MVRGIYTAAASMIALGAQQDVIGNNMANLNTTGFKRDLVLYRTRDERSFVRVSPPGPSTGGQAEITALGSVFNDSVLDQISTSYSQGDLKRTDVKTDLGMRGEAYFVVRTDQGEALTRNGSFEVDFNRRLVDHSGNPVLGEGGEIVLPPRGEMTISEDGTVSIGDQVVDRLRLLNVADPINQLEKRGNSYYYVIQGAATPPTSFAVQQGFIEASTANPITEMVAMITAMRSYEAAQKMLTTFDETVGRAVNDIGRPA